MDRLLFPRQKNKTHNGGITKASFLTYNATSTDLITAVAAPFNLVIPKTRVIRAWVQYV